MTLFIVLFKKKQFFGCLAFSFLFKNISLKKCVSQILYFYDTENKVISNRIQNENKWNTESLLKEMEINKKSLKSGGN